MARIIENGQGIRRLIKLSSDDIISVIQNYQQVVPRKQTSLQEVRNYLSDIVMYLPEDV